MQRPVAVRFIVHGVQFDEGITLTMATWKWTSDWIRVLFEGSNCLAANEEHVRYNVAKLVAFTIAVQNNCKLSGRVLWSESENNLAQKLIAQLQQTQ